MPLLLAWVRSWEEGAVPGREAPFCGINDREEVCRDVCGRCCWALFCCICRRSSLPELRRMCGGAWRGGGEEVSESILGGRQDGGRWGGRRQWRRGRRWMRGVRRCRADGVVWRVNSECCGWVLGREPGGPGKEKAAWSGGHWTLSHSDRPEGVAGEVEGGWAVVCRGGEGVVQEGGGGGEVLLAGWRRAQERVCASRRACVRAWWIARRAYPVVVPTLRIAAMPIKWARPI